MSLHGGVWRVHASAVDDLELISDSLKWLSDDIEGVNTERIKSALGAPMYCIECRMNSKKARESLGKIGQDSLNSLLSSGIGLKIDEDKVLHIRLDLGSLVRGKPVLARESGVSVVKGRFKLEVYPGQDASTIAERLIKEASRT